MSSLLLSFKRGGIIVRTYGIELETSSISIRTAADALERVGLNWSCKPDGTSGVDAEAVSPILTDATLGESITAARALLRAGATVNRQTGYHVHLGAEHYGNEGIAALVRNWYTAAEAIGALVAPSRLNNRFCNHNLSAEVVDAWAESIRGGTISNRAANYNRYLSLNLDSFDRHGTVEFRLHHGTLNGKKIQAWAQFCEAIATYSTNGGTLSEGTGSRLNDCKNLLDILTLADALDESVAAYLKGRADELSA
jgi:Putative amidoligase enzyme